MRAPATMPRSGPAAPADALADALAHPARSARPAVPPPLGAPPDQVRAWFDRCRRGPVPAFDGTLAPPGRRPSLRPARQGGQHAARLPRRRAAWCTWCDQHALPCLPARAADVIAFLAAEHGRGPASPPSSCAAPPSAICTSSPAARCPPPRPRSPRPWPASAAPPPRVAPCRPKLAATVGILRQILAPIGDDLVGLRDRALLLVGFAGALRRAELAAIRVDHIEPRGVACA